MKFTLLPTLAMSTALIAPTAQADQVFNDDVIITGSTCIGGGCDNGELFGGATLKLKSEVARIEAGATFAPARTIWRLVFNETGTNGQDKFILQNLSDGRLPFVVEAAAPSNAIYTNGLGNVGLGTSLPLTGLHMVETASPTIRLEQTIGGGLPNQTWDVGGSDQSFFIRDVTNGSARVFRIEPDAEDQALVLTPDEMVVNEDSASYDFRVESNGLTAALFVDGTSSNVGIGTGNPGAPLELSQDETFNFFRITASKAEINESVDITFTGGPLGTGQLRYNIVDGDNQEMSLDANGNLVIDGTLTTAGPQCDAGCDRVFEAGYALPTIEEHHAAMWAQGYLPNVGPTLPGQPINVSDKLGRVLNELEHAHIFIGQQQEMIHDLQARLSVLEAQ